MKKILFLLLVVVLLSGCQLSDDMKKQGGLGSYLKCKSDSSKCIQEENETETDMNLTGTEPDIIPSKVIYYFEPEDNIVEGLTMFIQEKKQFLYCQFQLLENKQIGDSITNQGGEITVVLGKEGTMTDCDNVCVPKTESQYNHLYANGVDVRIKEDVNSNYCITHDKVFLTSKSFDGYWLTLDNYAVIIYNDELALAYKQEFTKRWTTGN